MSIKALAPYAIPYNKYVYIWSPRPELSLHPDKLPEYDNNRFFAQPKMNGANTLIFMNDAGEVHVKNRHNGDKTGNIKLDFGSLYRGTGWMVLNGEWMEKSQADEHGQNFNGNFCIFEILVYNGFILAGSKFEDRLALLSDLYQTRKLQVNNNGGMESRDYLYYTEIPNVYRVQTYNNRFNAMYRLLSAIPMYEGLVLKKKDAILLPPHGKSINSKWQLKARKPNKSYSF